MRLGIDFGTCYSSAALMLNNTLKPIKEPLKHGFSFPSSVFLTEQGEVLVGQAAVNSRQKEPRRYKEQFKRDLGSSDPYILGNQTMLPQELVAEVIRKLKTEADKVVQGWGQQSLTDVVITIPATYQGYKRDLMQKLSTQVGFAQVELLEEPLAAAIYYAHREHVSEGDIILVYDLGGGTFDATLVQKQTGDYQLLAMPKGLSHCGGTDFDREVYRDLRSRCSPNLQQQLDDKGAWLARAIVSDLCRELKHQLSEAREATIHIPLSLGAVESYSLTQEAFHGMIESLINETIDCCDQLVRSANLEWQQVKQVLLVGGSCRIPYVREAVARKLGRQPLLVDEPELAVCMGAAIYGAQLKAAPQNLKHKSDKSQGEQQPPEEQKAKDEQQQKSKAPHQLAELATAYYKQGLERNQEKNYWTAIEDFNQALKINPKYAEAYYERGISRFQLGDENGAIEDLEQAVKLFFDQGNLAEYRGVLEKIRQLNTSSAATSQSSSQVQPNAEQLCRQGIEKVKQGDYKAAIATFSQVLQQDSRNANAYFYRSFARFCLDENQTAIEDCNQAISIDSKHADAYVCRAFAHFSLEQYKNTVRDCNQALQINPNHGEAYLGLAVVRSLLHVHQKALEDFQKLRRVAPSANINYYNQILARAARGDRQTVIKDLKEAAKTLVTEFNAI